MATNITRTRIIHPDHVDDYHRPVVAHGSILFTAGVILAAQAAFSSRYFPEGSQGSLIALAAGGVVLVLGVVLGIVFAVKNRRRQKTMSVPAKPLRRAVSFNRKNVSDDVVWEAASIAAIDPDEARHLIESAQGAHEGDDEGETFFPLNEHTAVELDTADLPELEDATPAEGEFFSLATAPEEETRG